MRSLILCEGHDEVYFLGYYLHKTDGWFYYENEELSENYDLPKNKARNQIIEVYKKGNNSVAIWGVGGKDNFTKSFKFLEMVNHRNPEFGIEQVFVFLDRDDTEIEECLVVMGNKMRDCGLPVGDLKNNQCNAFRFEIEDETYQLNVIPVIIPFDEKGALETVLLDAIASVDDEGKFVVQGAKSYIDGFLKSGRQAKFLRKKRLEVKAEFSAAVSITNPDRSTVKFDTLLMSHPWEEMEIIRRHFGILNDELGG